MYSNYCIVLRSVIYEVYEVVLGWLALHHLVANVLHCVTKIMKIE